MNHNKIIDTKIWNDKTELGSSYVGQRLSLDVFSDIKKTLDIKLIEQNVSCEYISLNTNFKSKKSTFPIGTISISVQSGNSEGYKVNLNILKEDKYLTFLNIKTYSLKEALSISNVLTESMID